MDSSGCFTAKGVSLINRDKKMEVTIQPKAYAPKDFQTSLLSCCDDIGVCCCGTFCLPCLGCSIASDMNECCACGLGMHMRSVYRERYNIPGSMCNDCVVNYFCACCASCQLKRDIKIRKSNGEF